MGKSLIVNIPMDLNPCQFCYFTHSQNTMKPEVLMEYQTEILTRNGLLNYFPATI